MRGRHSVPAVFGRRVRRERERRGWNLRQLGDASGGVSVNTVMRVEAGNDVMLSNAIMLSAAFGASLGDMLDESSCQTCDGIPPAGFICKECGREGAS
jgi:transcriptional regulator with XRE-family HTH domain